MKPAVTDYAAITHDLRASPDADKGAGDGKDQSERPLSASSEVTSALSRSSPPYCGA
jgi:hypothetical protein